MTIVIKPDGSTFVTAANIGYGSTVNQIGIVAPFTNGTMTIAFQLPNGIMLEPKLCTPAAATGTDFGVWTILLTADITAQAGTAGYIIKITDQYGNIWTSQPGTFPVSGGIATILPPIPGSTTYADILAVLSAINTNYQAVIDALDDVAGDVSTLKTKVGNASDAANASGSIYARIAKLIADVDTKVDKVVGKGLSANDYTDLEKAKLAAIAPGAEVNVQPDWNQTNTGADDYIKNKPNIGTTADPANASGTIYARIKHNFDKIVINTAAIGDESTSGTIIYRIKAQETKTGGMENDIAALQATLESRQQPIAIDDTEYLSNWLQGVAGYTVSVDGQPFTPADLITGTVILIRATQEPDFWWDGGVSVAGTVEVNGVEYVSTAEVGGVVIGGVRELEYNFSEVSAAVSAAESAQSAAELAQSASETARDEARKWVDGTGATSEDPQYENNAKYYSEHAGASAFAADQSRQAAEDAAEQVIAVLENVDALYASMLDDTNTSVIFGNWYSAVKDSGIPKYDLLSRFFRMCSINNNQQHTVRFYAAEASSNSQGTPLDWLADKTAAPLATDTNDPGAGWDEENRLTWYIRANALSLADGTMNVLYIEGESGFDITGEIAPVYTFQIAPWFKETVDDQYEIRSWRATRAAGYEPCPWDVAPDGTKRYMTWHPTFCGSLTTAGKLTSGSGRSPALFCSAAQGNTAAKLWNAYEGVWSDGDTKWVLYEWQHRHWYKENSDILEGCTSYYYSYQCAVAETNAQRVIITPAQAANLIVGSSVSIGDTERASANVRAKIISKENISIESIEYTALLLDSTVTTTTATYVSTMPWNTGATEVLPERRDGAPGSLTNSRYPCRIAGVEMLIGCYEIGLDPLYNVTANAVAGFDYAIYQCKNSEKLASSITADYIDTGLRYNGMLNEWSYVKAFITTKLAILFPRLLGGSSSGYYRSAFYGTGSAGVRAPWRFCNLSTGGSAGLAGELGGYSPATSTWNGAPRLTGSGKKRGEWTA